MIKCRPLAVSPATPPPALVAAGPMTFGLHCCMCDCHLERGNTLHPSGLLHGLQFFLATPEPVLAQAHSASCVRRPRTSRKRAYSLTGASPTLPPPRVQEHMPHRTDDLLPRGDGPHTGAAGPAGQVREQDPDADQDRPQLQGTRAVHHPTASPRPPNLSPPRHQQRQPPMSIERSQSVSISCQSARAAAHVAQVKRSWHSISAHGSVCTHGWSGWDCLPLPLEVDGGN